ncbi:MAG: polyisoprenoid-binding protein, partial [Bacteroidetes bacterium]
MATNMQTWNIDPTHSEIQFKVRHMMISTVSGVFHQFTGQMKASEADFSDAEISFEADIDSIDTRNEQRDGHLKSNDFFNAAEFPKMTFRSTSFEKTGEGTFVLKGDLTIRDVTQAVSLDVEYGGTLQDPYGQTRAGFEISGKINRKDFNLNWDAVTEAGSVVVSNEVKLLLNVQMVLEQPVA